MGVCEVAVMEIEGRSCVEELELGLTNSFLVAHRSLMA